MIGAIFRGTGHVLAAMPFLSIPMILYMLAGLSRYEIKYEGLRLSFDGR